MNNKKNWRVISSTNWWDPRRFANQEWDPWRTLLLENAHVFNTKEIAEDHTLKIIKENKHRPHLKENLFTCEI